MVHCLLVFVVGVGFFLCGPNQNFITLIQKKTDNCGVVPNTCASFSCDVCKLRQTGNVLTNAYCRITPAWYEDAHSLSLLGIYLLVRNYFMWDLF